MFKVEVDGVLLDYRSVPLLDLEGIKTAVEAETALAELAVKANVAEVAEIRRDEMESQVCFNGMVMESDVDTILDGIYASYTEMGIGEYIRGAGSSSHHQMFRPVIKNIENGVCPVMEVLESHVLNQFFTDTDIIDIKYSRTEEMIISGV